MDVCSTAVYLRARWPPHLRDDALVVAAARRGDEHDGETIHGVVPDEGRARGVQIEVLKRPLPRIAARRGARPNGDGRRRHAVCAKRSPFVK